MVSIATGYEEGDHWKFKGRRLGRVLTKMGALTREQVHEALANQRARMDRGERVQLGDILVEMEVVTQEVVDEALRLQAGEELGDDSSDH